MTLSDSQRKIADLVEQGVTSVGELARRLGKSEGIIRAQVTRMQTKGEGSRVASIKDAMPTSSGPAAPVRDKPRAPAGSSSNAAVLREAQEAGQAEFKIPDHLVKEFQDQFGGKTDVHPMVLFGVAIQFVKLVGGRLSAHQLIEQVYDALRTMVSDGSPKVGKEQWSAPWPLNAVEAENAELKARIEQLEQQVLGADMPTHEPPPEEMSATEKDLRRRGSLGNEDMGAHGT